MISKEFILHTKLASWQAALFYLGQESFLIKYCGKYFLIDPYLSDYVDRNCRTPEVPWERRYPAPIQADELDFIDYVLCTHDHFDHADPETLHTLASCCPNAKFIVPAPIRDTILSYGITPEQLIAAHADEEISLELLPAHFAKVIPVPSAHEELHQDASGDYKELGYKIQLGDLSLYHAGDCCIYDGLAERLMHTDVVMLPVNGRSYYKLHQDIIGNMTAEEAVLLAKEIQAELLIPMHYDLYAVNSITPTAFVDAISSIHPNQKFHMFVPGERYILSEDPK